MEVDGRLRLPSSWTPACQPTTADEDLQVIRVASASSRRKPEEGEEDHRIQRRSTDPGGGRRVRRCATAMAAWIILWRPSDHSSRRPVRVSVYGAPRTSRPPRPGQP